MFAKTDCWPIHRVSDSVSLRWLQNSISNNFLGDTDSAGLRPHFENHCLRTPLEVKCHCSQCTERKWKLREQWFCKWWIQVLETASPMFLWLHHMNICKILTIFHFLTKKAVYIWSDFVLRGWLLENTITCSCVSFTAISTWIGSQVAQNCKCRKEAHSCYFKWLQ